MENSSNKERLNNSENFKNSLSDNDIGVKIDDCQSQLSGEIIFNDSNKNVNNINFLESDNNSSNYNINENNEEIKSDISQIEGEREASNLNSTSDNLSVLFRDYISKKDNERTDSKNRPRKSIYNLSRDRKFSVISEESERINFGSIINAQLNEVKENTISYLEKTKKELETKYTNYIKKINAFISENEKKISKALENSNISEDNKISTRNEDGDHENFINYANNNLFKQIDNLLEIHENIFSALEDHFNLLYLFLEQSILIQQKKPIEYFINTNSNDILQSWFLNKINFDNLNLTNIFGNKDISDICTRYLCNKNDNNFASVTIEKTDDNKSLIESQFLKENLNKVKKLKFINLTKDDVIKVLDKIESNKSKSTKSLNQVKTKNKNNKTVVNIFSDENSVISELSDNCGKNGKKLRCLVIENSTFTTSDFQKILFPTLEKIKIKKSPVSLNMLFNCIFCYTNNLKTLKLENANLVDKNLIDFFEELSQKNSLQDSLEFLSFKRNNLTRVNLSMFMSKEGSLSNLRTFDLSKNNIYDFFIDNFKVMPKLKVLDLTDNNMNNHLFGNMIWDKNKKLKFIVFLSNNIFIHNNRMNNNNYIKYLCKMLRSFEFKIKKISFCFLFNKDNYQYLTKLRISPAVKISVIKLDLSFCGLLDETLWKFFKNNFGLLNLEILNLSNNFLTINFFKFCSGEENDIIIEKIIDIDLSGNDIQIQFIQNFKILQKFIENHTDLEKIKLQQTPFIQGFKKYVENNYNQEMKVAINKMIEKNFKFVFEPELSGYMNNPDINKILSYKDKSC